jgi:hypothetical protein
MKTIKQLILLGLAAATGAGVLAQEVKVDFVEANGFTDFTNTPRRATGGQQSYIKTLTAFLEKKLEDRLPPGQQVHLVFTDIDMAGEFEPWRPGGFDDVRIVKDLYPPRINLSYSLTDEAGNVLRQKNCKLRDLSFMYTSGALDTDPLRHEKELLSQWVYREFKVAGKT